MCVEIKNSEAAGGGNFIATFVQAWKVRFASNVLMPLFEMLEDLKDETHYFQATLKTGSAREQRKNLFQNQSRIVSIDDVHTPEEAQILNHDMSVDVSAMAINYHQMVAGRDIIKSNGTDYFKLFFVAVIGVA